MIINFDRGYGQTPEQMIQSLMESTQMALDNSDRAATTNHEMLQSSIDALEKKIGQGGGSSSSANIIIKSHTKTVTVSGSDSLGVSFSAADIAVEGYTPIAAAGVSTSGSGNSYIGFYRWAVSDDKTSYYIGLRNSASTDKTIELNIKIMYVANDSITYGERGPKGDTGATGPRGLTGETGAAGSDGVSCTHEWNGTTLTVTSASGTSSADLKGADGTNGSNGNDGARGTSILAITTAPSSYTTAVGGVTPSYRISLATVTTQAGMAPNVGDQLRYLYYLYPVIYIDDNYAYCKARVSIRGANGTSATHSWDGTVLTVTSASGTSSADLQGPQGIQGEPGVQGETGPAGTITVNSVTTGEPGSNASVTNVGSTTAAQLDFVIPRGAKGEKGDRGDPGTIDETTKAQIVSEAKSSILSEDANFGGELKKDGVDVSLDGHTHIVSNIADLPKWVSAGTGSGVVLVGDLLIQYGNVSLTPTGSSANYTASRAITFNTTYKYKYTPVIQVSAQSGSNLNVIRSTFADPTKDGFTIWLIRSNKTETGCWWIAVGQKA